MNQNTSNTAAQPHNSLANHFLIAMPQLRDSYFANTVIYLWRHTEEGALGLVVNLPISMQLDEVFEQLGVAYLKNDSTSQIVLSGGPVETSKGFILHDAPPRWPSSIAITDQLTITTSRDILSDIAKGEGPSHFLMALGCAGWSPGQLEEEIKSNSWFTCPATSDILFSTDYAKKPEMAAAKLGFSLSQLTTDVGYS